MLGKKIISKHIKQFLAEDLGLDKLDDNFELKDIYELDVSSAILPNDLIYRANVIAREEGVLCGLPWVREAIKLSDNLSLKEHKQEGEVFKQNDTLFTLKGLAKDILILERSLLNLIQTLSATATITQKYVAEIQKHNSNIKILDTRKTIPGLRFAQKYAVRVGNGCNHRFGLFDMILLKENHIKALGGVANAIITAKKSNSKSNKIEVEVCNLEEFKIALPIDIDIIMLDNFSIPDIIAATKLKTAENSKTEIEVSGSINLDNLSHMLKQNIQVDYISIGALTKNIKALDLSMLFEEVNV